MDKLSIDNSVLLPELKAGWVFNRNSETPSLDRAATAERFEINPITAMIVGYCDGRNSIELIIETLCAQFPEATENIPGDVESVLRDLHQGDVLAFTPTREQKVFDAPDKSPPNTQRHKLCIGMATYDDYDGVYFSVQAIRLYHPEIVDDIEIVVIDNNPTGPCAEALNKLGHWIPNYRYIPCESIRGTAVRDVIFREANAEYVLCIDSHVMIAAGVIRQLLDYFEAHPDTPDLLQGPLINDDMRNTSTHFNPEWRDGMYGTWGNNELARDPDAPAFDIPMQGLGLFACSKAAGPGFNSRFSGFGGEEGYIHEKFRQAGGRTLCLPFLRWLHRFVRPMGTRYKVKWEDRIRNYLIGHDELGLETGELIEHFKSHIGEKGAMSILEDVQLEIANPFFYFDAIYCIVADEDISQWIALQKVLDDFGILHRLKQFSAAGLAEEQQTGIVIAHQRIIQEANASGYQNVLIFEEGQLPSKNLDATFIPAIQQLKEQEWGLFFLDGATAYHRSIFAKLLGELPESEEQAQTWLDSELSLAAYYERNIGQTMTLSENTLN